MDATDEVLAEQWRTGAPLAARLLVHRYAAALRRFFVNKCAEVPDDPVQQTFAACFLAISRFRHEASFRTFLFRIARNQLFEHYRRQRRLRELRSQAMTLLPAPSAVSEHEQSMEAAVTHALHALPPELRQVIELMYWSERTQAEIGAQLGIPPGTVASRVRRAKARMRAHLIATTFDAQSGDTRDTA